MSRTARSDGPNDDRGGPPRPILPTVAALEQRIQRLEDAVTLLQDTQSLEERVTHRVTERLGPRATHPIVEASGIIVEAGRQLLPTAIPISPIPESPAGRGWTFPTTWLLADLWAEARAILRMYTDPRYRLRWSARVVPLVLVLMVVTLRIWMPGTEVSIIGNLIDKAATLVLAFVLFKFLGHEARRYRQTAPDLPPTLRL